MYWFMLKSIYVLSLIHGGITVDLEFENPDSGFFVRPPANEDHSRQNVSLAVSNSPWDMTSNDGSVVDIEKFTILDQTRPALVRASYGPFSTKQTVPARYIIPVYADEETNTSISNFMINDTFAFSESKIPDFSSSSHQLQISAHLVVKELTRTQPALRVLIHGAGAKGHHSPHVCVTAIVKKGLEVLSASCTPAGAGETGSDATCLITMNIPPKWWPMRTRTKIKSPKTEVGVFYMVGTASGPYECHGKASTDYDSLINNGEPRITIQPETFIGNVLLALDSDEFSELGTDSLVRVLVPKYPLNPGSTVHIPVYLHPTENVPAIIVVIRCRVRNGSKLTGVEASNPAWNLTVEFNKRKSAATVTAMLIDKLSNNSTLHSLSSQEVFSWILQIPAGATAGETKVSWSIQYVMNALYEEQFLENSGRRINARLTILKDDIQAVLPIAKSWSIVNTAVLTGRQVSRAMKVLIVSQAGKVADVTLQSSCICTDEAALKVSSSCTSVYLDGSEIRGSQNATISALYGQLSGKASFTVWMPEFPLNILVSDSKLSQIKNWKAPRLQSNHLFKFKSTLRSSSNGEMNDESHGVCSPMFQQTSIQVYGKFVAVDDNSGRESYLLSRKTSLRVTEIVSHLLRVSDASVASLEKTTVKGMLVGRTEIQVLSPITGRVIGSQDLKVSMDKISIKKLHATIISGLTLSLQPDPQIKDGFDAISTFTPALTAKYQEGLIDIWLEFSDGTITPLRELRPETFSLKVKSLNPSVVVVAPSPLQSQPRVIAIGHGEGNFLQVSLEIPRSCGVYQPTLATTVVKIKVDLGNETLASVNFGNEHHTYPKEAFKNFDNDKYSVEKPIADAASPYSSHSNSEISSQPEVQARMHPSIPTKVTGLEVGMYVLLAIFGVAIIVFAGSCIVYSYKGVGIPLNNNYPLGRHDSESNDSISNAHDWVWLGKATLERASGVGIKVSKNGPSESLLPLSDLKKDADIGQTSSWREYHRFTRSRDPNGFISQINITNNPGSELLEPLLGNEEDTSPGAVSSATFTRPPTKSNRKVTFNNLNNKRAGARSINDNILPKRPCSNNSNNSDSANFLQQSRQLQEPRGEKSSPVPPPIPPHGVNVFANPFDIPSAQQVTLGKPRRERGTETMSSEQPPLIVRQKEEEDGEHVDNGTTKFIEVNGDDFVRLRGVTRGRAAQIKRATILENPLLSSAIPKSVDINEHLDNLPNTIDYDHLLEYFANLKESCA